MILLLSHKYISLFGSLIEIVYAQGQKKFFVYYFTFWKQPFVFSLITSDVIYFSTFKLKFNEKIGKLVQN